MPDPHVATLHYKLIADGGTTRFDNAPAVETATPGFRARLADDVLRVDLVDHHATIEAARGALEPFLRMWERSALTADPPLRLRFEFERADAEDKEAATAYRTRDVYYSTDVVVVRSMPGYPLPLARFAVSADVETMCQRYEGHLAGREPLASMAYFCLTLVEKYRAHSRDQAAAGFRISRPTLRKLGELTAASVGDRLTARKLGPASTLRQLTDAEGAWIGAAVRALIRRVGEYDVDPTTANTLPPITMADLPALP